MGGPALLMTDRPPRGRRLLIFAVALLLLRALFLVAALDPSEGQVMETFDALGQEWPRGPQRPVYDSEELYYGTAAQAMLEGVGLPILGYRTESFSQGTVLLSLLTVPLYAIFGPNYLAFKLIPLVITVLCGCAWVAVVRAWFGERAAGMFALLFLFAPSTLVRTALIAHSSHPEALALLGGVFYLATRAARAEREGARDRWALASGVLGGLSVYATFAVLPVLAGVGVTAFALTRARPFRAWMAYGSGLLLGLVPWSIAAIAKGRASVEVYGRGLAELVGPESWSRLQVLVAEGLLVNYDVPGGAVPRALAGWLFLVVVALGWIALARSKRRSIALLVLAGTAMHLAAFVLRAPDESPRYLIPAYGFLLLAVVGSAGISRSAFRWRLAPYLTVLLIGITAQATVLGRSSFPALRTPLAGFNWMLMGEIVGRRISTDTIEGLPERVRPFFWVGNGIRTFQAGFALQHGRVPAPELWRSAARVAGPEGSARVWQGIGIWWQATLQGRGAPGYLSTPLPDSEREDLLRGLFTYGDYFVADGLRLEGVIGMGDLIRAFAPRDRGPVVRSCAYSLAVLHTQGVPDTVLGARVDEALWDARAREHAAGRAIYRGSTGRDGLTLWRPVSGEWVMSAYDSLKSGNASAAVWAGIAESYGRDLHTRAPGWVIGGKDGPVAMSEELSRITQGLSPEKAAQLYRAAGGAAARAMSIPFTRLPDPWAWESAIPRDHHDAFREGFEDQRLDG